jgi:maltose O-acetyltransferase
MDNNIYEWTIDTIPNNNIPIRRWVQRMNKWGNLPFPFDRPANFYKKKIISSLKNVETIEFPFDFSFIYGNIYGKSIEFGNKNILLDYAPIFFGDIITLGFDIKLITSSHPLENFHKVKAAPIVIGNNVWLTMNIIVLPGVEIGDNTVVGAGSVVTKSLPPNVLAAGNPAKVVKSISREFKWWEKVKS